MKNFYTKVVLFVLKMIIINLCIFVIFFVNINLSGPVNKNELTKVVGTIDDVIVSGGGRYSTAHAVIRIDKNTYYYHKLSRNINVDFEDICKNLKIGNVVEFYYKTVYDYFYKYNDIYELYINGVPYQTVEIYNEHVAGSDTVWIVLFIIAVTIQVLYHVFLIYLNYDEIKKYVKQILLKRKKKK